MRGRFISFEGPEGCGKSTQAKLLIARLQAEGLTVTSAREPGGTRTGEIIRDILQHDLSKETIFPEAEVLLFAASRAQIVRQHIEPALQAGTWVVCDRFMDSTTAYQGYGRGFDVERVIDINAFAVGHTVPDVTFLLALDVDTSLARMESRNRERRQGQDRFEREGRDFHARIHAGYQAMARRWPARFRVIDGDRPAEAVAADIWAEVTLARHRTLADSEGTPQ
ncbi:MAG: dTMP kinase [Verrucomicrobia bacterium]|nr:dTMP kinase [Verrucomicrobiota bacterium]